MGKPILCLDFDGVIHSYTSGWKGAATVSDPPVLGAFEFIEQALDHFDVQIFSSRTGQWEDRDSGLQRVTGERAMQEWFEMWAVRSLGHVRGHGVLGLVGWPSKKPSAFVTIDDRALTFDGTWPDLETLKSFKPWNKR
jgi:hypothetical protein